MKLPAPSAEKTPKKSGPKTAKIVRAETRQEARRLEQWAMLDAARVLVGDHRTASCYRVTLPLQVSGLDERGAGKRRANEQARG